MNIPGLVSLQGSFISLSRYCYCCRVPFQLSTCSPVILGRRKNVFTPLQLPRQKLICRSSETETEPDGDDNEKERGLHEDEDQLKSSDKITENDSSKEKEQFAETEILESKSQEIQNGVEIKEQVGAEVNSEIQVATGSPLPGVKPQQFDESIQIAKETIDILKDQIFAFDTFFVTSQEPYEGGVLFKGNLRGQATKTHEKITRRMQDRFGDVYKLFILINPEDDKPVAVVVPKITLQQSSTAVPEWFAAGAFGLVTIFTLLLRNVPALQTNVFSAFDNPELLKEGLPGAIVTALVLGVHEISHIVASKSSGIMLGVPYFVPSWQIGSFGAITRIINIVRNREDLLKFAAAGPIAGFSLGFILLLIGLILPPLDGLGVVVDASVFHESLLVGGIAKLLLGDVLKEGTPISVNPLVIWSGVGLLINALNSIPAGELDGGRISFALWGRKASYRLSAVSIGLLGLSSLFSDVAFYWAVLIFFLQRGPIAPLAEEISDPDDKYVTLGVVVLLLGLLVCLPYPFPFTSDPLSGF